MKILELRIDEWRNFRDVRLTVPPDASLVCLIGENGTGKSNILELLAAAAHRLGISSGVDIPRGDPFQELHAFTVVLQLTESEAALVSPELWTQHVGPAGEWDRTVRLESRRGADGDPVQQVTAAGAADPQPTRSFAEQVVQQLRQREETQHLYLDADRAYPPLQIQPYQYAEALSQPYESIELTKQWAFRPTRAMYEEWIKYFLGREVSHDTEYVQQIRRARETGGPQPQFEDPFSSYRDAVLQVLPHVRFVGADTTNRTILFDTAGSQLSFPKLSGGEREIAFLIGQIERFQLRRGLLLLDEPELHLNPDLLRTWVAWLRDSVQEGQVWLATHSLEAVEVAGPSSTFVMERAGDSRTVQRVSPLGSRPVISALSAAVGAPAFSISRLRFVYVEGERQTRERERFYQICGEPTVNRFLEAGGCTEVIRKLATVRALAQETEEQVRVGGVIDRDFRTPPQMAELQTQASVHVLGCHEIENLYLYPDAIGELLRRAGRSPDETQGILQTVSDRFAGLWIVQRTAMRHPDFPEPTPLVRELAGGLKWDTVADDKERAVRDIVSRYGPLEAGVESKLINSLLRSADVYEKLRESPDLWKTCLGKQVLNSIPRALGLNSADSLERHVFQLWTDKAVALPAEALELLAYLHRI
ncbi:MAG TPA: AAA family ATPase [Chloroflexota bacterium]|nr:AAA family ATPase [Chloroflexota bacterium]